ncbi:MAG: polysaccharide deacetylase family protein [bacterium]
MPGTLLIIWDYDSALGQINSTMPYNFKYSPIYEEIENVEYILKVGREHDIKMTFACLGFAAEAGILPFNNPGQIKKIFDEGHEIASHSWRHEWFPLLMEKQIQKSLERSKYILENCIDSKDAVKGFVPPHSRPMSWYKKFSFSLGDRAVYPFHKGSDMDYILNRLSVLNYNWCRVLVKYKPVWVKMFGNSNEDSYSFSRWEIHHGVVCVPQHYTGFDEPAINYLKLAIQKNETVVIVGHPAGLSREKSESLNNFNNFIEEVNKYISSGKLNVTTVSDYINKNILNFKES